MIQFAGVKKKKKLRWDGAIKRATFLKQLNVLFV